jgi:hypothetical protein
MNWIGLNQPKQTLVRHGLDLIRTTVLPFLRPRGTHERATKLAQSTRYSIVALLERQQHPTTTTIVPIEIQIGKAFDLAVELELEQSL